MPTNFFFLDDIGPIGTAETRDLLQIYSGKDAEIPKDFNSIKIILNGRLDSSLDWKEKLDQADHYIKKGMNILWHLDLGLFEHLPEPISDQTQYLSLGLSIKHFRDKVWARFQSHTAGVVIYEGPIDLHSGVRWDQKLSDDFEAVKKSNPTFNINYLSTIFSNQAGMDYIDLLAGQMPGELPVSILMDASKINDFFLLAQLLSKERFDRLHRAISNSPLPFECFSNNIFATMSDGQLPKTDFKSINLGFCIPMRSQWFSEKILPTKAAFEKILEKNILFRVISEATLTTEWDGLDKLIVDEDALGPQGLRKLNGFIAAGGVVVKTQDIV